MEKAGYDVILQSVGRRKMEVIQEVRAATGLGLAEAVKLVDSSPVLLKSGMSQEAAERVQRALARVGATVEIL